MPAEFNRAGVRVGGLANHFNHQPSARDVTTARDEAIAKSVTINALVILTETPTGWNSYHTNPPGGLANYYRNNVIGGPGAFVMVVENFNSFSDVLVKKLIAEIAQAVPPAAGGKLTRPPSKQMPLYRKRCNIFLADPLCAAVTEGKSAECGVVERGCPGTLTLVVHGTPDVQLSAVPLEGIFSGIRTGSLGAGSVGVGVGLGTTTGLGIVSGISMGSEPG